MKLLEVPFVFGKIADFDNFTDRAEEKVRLQQNFNALINTTIISPRRWGKSSLVKAAARDAESQDKKLKICMIDLFNIRDEAGFYSLLSKQVIKAASSKWEERLKDARAFLSHLRPTITFGNAFTEEVSFDVEWEKVALDPDDVLDLAENIAKSRGLKLVICIDEFQSIGGFKDSLAFQRKLRSHWQQHNNACYCLYGSKRHMLLDIFSNSSMPFYRFGDIMLLQKIENAQWAEFVHKRFEDTGKTITLGHAAYLAELVDNHSYYVQQLAQQSWLRTEQSCSIEVIDAAFESMVDQLSLTFTNLTETLSNKQLNLIKALLDGVKELSSTDTLKNYKLGTSANVSKLKAALQEREIIDITGKDIQILDPVFKHWLSREFFL